MSELQPLCQRLLGLIRQRIFEILITTLPKKEDDEQAYHGVLAAMFRELMIGRELHQKSEALVGFAGLRTHFPESFNNICLLGDLSCWLILGGEAGKLHLAAKRLTGSIRFRIFDLLITTLPAAHQNQEADYICIAKALIREFEKGCHLFEVSNDFAGIQGIQQHFPLTYKKIVIDGDFSGGVILNEDNDFSGPFVPFGANG